MELLIWAIGSVMNLTFQAAAVIFFMCNARSAAALSIFMRAPCCVAIRFRQAVRIDSHLVSCPATSFLVAFRCPVDTETKLRGDKDR